MKCPTQKMIDALAELAKLQYERKTLTLAEVNAAKPTDALDREWLIEMFNKEAGKYKETVRELCDQIRLAEAMSEEEAPVDHLMSAANLAVSRRMNSHRIYNAIVDAIDFMFDRQF